MSDAPRAPKSEPNKLSGDKATLLKYLEIYAGRQVYYDGSLMNIVLAVVGGNGALLAAFTVLDKEKYGFFVSLLGLVAAVVMGIAIANSRRQLGSAERRGFRVQNLLPIGLPEDVASGINPFRDPNRTRSGIRTPGLIAYIAGAVWLVMTASHSPLVARYLHELVPSMF